MVADGLPFIGPRPFAADHRDRFFGRTREIADLASLVIAHPIVFLYGQSGVGKTSLLQAGLIPFLVETEGFDVLPVVRPGGLVEQLGSEQTTASPYVYAALRTWSGPDPEPPTDASLAAFLARRPPRLDDDEWPAPRLLVFDQLEELFTEQRDTAQERQEFFEQLGALLEDARARVTPRGDLLPSALVPTRVLLAMREEYIAELDPYAALLPDKLRIRMRLERLRGPAALEAISRPLAPTRWRFAPGVAEQLVADLREVRVETGYGEQRTAAYVLGEFVEPVQLQVVGERLLRNLPPTATEITADHLSQFGSVDATLMAFYQDAVAAAADSAGVPRDALAAWCETHLVTATGTRAIVHRGPTTSDGIANAAPDALVDRFLLRVEQRAGAFWYELAHDRLIGPIQAARAVRERREAERRGAELARQRAARGRRARRFAAAFAVVALLAILVPVAWLRVRGPDCEGTLRCVWTFPTGDWGFGRPAVAGSLVYVPSTDAHVYAIDSSEPRQLWGPVRDAAQRQELWRFATGGKVWSSPVVSDGVVYFGSEDGNLYAVDAVTGAERWRFDSDNAITGSPALGNGALYIGTLGRSLYAIDLETHRQRWRFAAGDRIIASPAVDAGVVYVGSTDKRLYAIDEATGRELWRFEAGDEIRTDPAVNGRTVYVGSNDHRLYAIDIDTHQPRWILQTGGVIRSSPVVANGVVYVGSLDATVYAVDAATGSVRWRFTTGEMVVSSPLVVGGVVYIGSSDKRFYALDAETGTILGALVTAAEIQSFPAAAGRQVIFGSTDGTVYAIDQASAPAPPAAGATPVTP